MFKNLPIYQSVSPIKVKKNPESGRHVSAAAAATFKCLFFSGDKNSHLYVTIRCVSALFIGLSVFEVSLVKWTIRPRNPNNVEAISFN